MRKHQWLVNLFFLVIISGVLLTVSCSTKKTAPASDAAPVTVYEEDEAARQAREAAKAQEMERQRLLEEQRLMEEKQLQQARQRAKEKFVNEDIFFDYDSFSLTESAQEILQEKAAWLRANSNIAIIIEGHCDERGTTEYNLALGDRRALSVRDFIVNLGISKTRITTISYGEERPIEQGHNESVWAKNRRAHFVIE